jgi:hypothetical protein
MLRTPQRRPTLDDSTGNLAGVRAVESDTFLTAKGAQRED